MAYRLNGRFVSKATWLAAQPRQIEVTPLPQVMNGFRSRQVESMLHKIDAQLIERRAFEETARPNKTHIELREAEKQLRGNETVARFFLANSVDPSRVLNWTRKDGYRSNLKGIRKLRKLCEFVANYGSIDRVSKALFAATIIAANRGCGWISNSQQELILSDLPVSTLPQELREAVSEWQNRYMSLTHESRNQSCQWRTTYENCGAYAMSAQDTVNGQELGVTVNMDSPLVQYLNNRWKLDSVS